MHLFHRYSWGWDLRIPFYGWLTWSHRDKHARLYLSPDATPSNPNTVFLYRR